MALKLNPDQIASLKAELAKAVDYQDDLGTLRQEYQSLYSMSKDAKLIKPMNREGFSQTMASNVFEAVEGMKVGLDAIFTSPDFFEVKVSGDQAAGERLRELIRYNMFIAQYGARELRAFIHQALVAQYAVIKCWWTQEYEVMDSRNWDMLGVQEAQALIAEGWVFPKYEELLQPTFDPMTGQIGESLLGFAKVKGIKRSMTYEGPKLETVPPENFFYTPGCKGLDSARLVAQKATKTLAEVRKGELDGLYKPGSVRKLLADNPGSLHRDDSTEKASRYEDDRLTYDELDQDQGSADKLTRPAQKVDIYEIYTSLDLDGDGLLEPIILHLCGDHVLSLKENPYRRPPYRIGRILEIPYRLEGKCFPEILQQDTVELTQMYRLWNDATSEAVYGTVVTNDAALADAWRDRTIGDVVLSPNLNPDRFFQVLRPDTPNAAILQAMESSEGRVERKTGVTRYNQGLDANSLNKTATGISIISSLAQQKQRFYAQVLGETIKDLVEDQIAVYRLFGQESLDVAAKKGLTVKAEDLLLDYTVEIEVGVSPQDRQQQAALLKEYLQMLFQGGLEMGIADTSDVVETIDRIGKLLNVPMDNLHKTPEEMDQMRQMQQMIQQLQQQNQILLQEINNGGQPQQNLAGPGLIPQTAPGQPGPVGPPAGAVPAPGAG